MDVDVTTLFSNTESACPVDTYYMKSGYSFPPDTPGIVDPKTLAQVTRTGTTLSMSPLHKGSFEFFIGAMTKSNIYAY